MNPPSSFFEWATAAAVVIAGGVAAYGQVDKLWRSRKKEDKDEDVKDGDRLINILKQTVDELEAKLTVQSDRIDELTVEIDKLKEENKTLVTVLQGRDGQTIEFQKTVLSAVVKSNETHELCKSTNANVERLCVLMEQHMKIIESKS